MIWSFMGLCFPNICLLKGVTRHMDIWHNHDALHKEELKRRQSLLSLLLAERIQKKARKCKWESVQGEDGYTTVHQSVWYACVPKHVQCFIKEKPWCCRVPAQGNKEESCYIDSEPTVVPSKLPGKLDWHGMMQAGRQAAGTEQERQNVSPASWSLIADWYIDCHWLCITKKRRKTGMIAERETMKVPVHSCAVILCVLGAYQCSACVSVCECTTESRGGSVQSTLSSC